MTAVQNAPLGVASTLMALPPVLLIPRWELRYRDLRFWVQARKPRPVGVFPENAVHWDWIAEQVRLAGRPAAGRDQPLRLNGLLATLAAAQAGAQIAQIDAFRKASA